MTHWTREGPGDPWSEKGRYFTSTTSSVGDPGDPVYLLEGVGGTGVPTREGFISPPFSPLLLAPRALPFYKEVGIVVPRKGDTRDFRGF